jgi:hypothetical protein
LSYAVNFFGDVVGEVGTTGYVLGNKNLIKF